MSSTLLTIPTELVERIVFHINEPDIGRLRLTCSTVCSKASRGRFKSLFHHRRTDLSHHSLERMRQITSHPEFGPLVKTLAMTPPAYNPAVLQREIERRERPKSSRHGMIFSTTFHRLSDADVEQAQASLAQLEAKQAEFVRRANEEEDLAELTAALAPLTRLEEIKFDVEVFEDGTQQKGKQARQCTRWFEVWRVAGHMFDMSLVALARSKTKVGKLDYFGDVIRCSVFLPHIEQHLREAVDAGLNSVLKDLKSLSLSVSTGIKKREEGGEGQAGDGVVPANGKPEERWLAQDTSLSTLLSMTPNLRELDLHLFRIHGYEPAYSPVFNNLAKTVKLPHLKSLRLRGLFASGADLLCFLRNSPNLESVEFRMIHLSDGDSWRPIIDELLSNSKTPSELGMAGNPRRLKRLLLDQLYEHYRIIFGEKKPPNPVDNTLYEAEGQELKKGVDYWIRNSENDGWRELGSPPLVRRIEMNRLEYGPIN